LRPDISIVFPARNERSRIAPTIESIARARTTDARVEFVVVDDASTDGCIENLMAAVPRLLDQPRVDIRVCRFDQHSGIFRARNQAAKLASADILFITDAHVRFSTGWDQCVFEHFRPDCLLAGTITQHGTAFHGYGCRLLVPFMGTTWNRTPVQEPTPVPVAACPATVIARDLYHELGGYDEGMYFYGAGEPEFSLRAWLHGADILVLGGLEVQHEFKPKPELSKFLASVRPHWVHNCLRFGLLYLSEAGCMQMLRYYACSSPHCQRALQLLERGDVWKRRKFLESRRERSFEWFVNRFELKNQIGGEII